MFAIFANFGNLGVTQNPAPASTSPSGVPAISRFVINALCILCGGKLHKAHPSLRLGSGADMADGEGCAVSRKHCISQAGRL